MMSLRRPLLLVLFIVVLVLAWRLRYLLMLVFGAVVLATVLQALADRLCRHLHVPARFSIVASVVLLLATLGGLTWAIGDAIADQSALLRERLPQALEVLRQWLASQRLGAMLLDYLQGLQDGELPWQRLAKLAGLTLEMLASVLLLMVLALYLAADPKLYADGTVRLMPRPSRGKVRIALHAAGSGLRRWLKGQAISMLCIGAGTALGLWLLGLPTALLLGLISGVFAFVPVYGAIAAGLLAVFTAFVDGPRTALYVALLFLLIQQIEEYLVLPFVQRWAVRLPPALGLVAAVAFGVLFGPLGVVFATPLMVVAMILVRELYVEEVADHPPQETSP